MPPFPKPKFQYTYDVSAEIDHLRQHKLTRGVPAKAPDRLLIATWNIASFGVQDRTGDDRQLIAEVVGGFVDASEGLPVVPPLHKVERGRGGEDPNGEGTGVRTGLGSASCSASRLRRLMLQGTPEPFSRTLRGTGRRPHARHPHRGRARRSEGGAPGRPSCCWAPSCRDHHSPLEPGDECATDRRDADAPRRVWLSIGR